MISRAPSVASSESDSLLTDPHGQQPVDLLLNLRRRRYGASHGVGPPSSSCQDLREPTPCPRRARLFTAPLRRHPAPSWLPHWTKTRSEERRVGKELRSRWSPYHAKKNAT